MTDFLDALVLLTNFVLLPGLTYGAQLALGALGVTLIYGILRFANFAHGDMMAFGAMVTLLVTWTLQENGVTIAPLPTALIALPAGILAAILLALATDRLVYRFYRRRRAPSVIYILTSIGVMFVLNGIVRFIIGPDDQRMTDGARFLMKAREFKQETGLHEGLVHLPILLSFIFRCRI
jgi:branched-chain amino acid transport system permease protein